MILPMLAALAAAGTVFVTVGALGGQYGTTRRRALARAERVASRPNPNTAPDNVLAQVLKPDALAGGARMRAWLRRYDWAYRRASLLERADVSLKVSEWLGVCLVVFLAAAVVTGLLSGIPVAGVGFGIGAVGLFEVWIRERARKQKDLFERQLPVALDTMATSLRSGFGIMESMRAVVRDSEEPLKSEFARVLDETRVGGSFEGAIERMGARVQSNDFRIVSRALSIHRAIGGDLAEVLDSVASTMRERAELRGHVQSLTAQQRMGGAIVGLLPIWVIAFFLVFEPEFIQPLWTEPVGRVIFAIGIGLDLTAFLIMRRILRIEV